MGDKDSGSAVYNILAFSFAGQDTASQTMKEIKSSGALDGYEIAAQATVDQDAKGKVHVHEPGRGGVGATVGAVAGGLLGLIGGPAGVLAMAGAGAAVGGTAGHYWGRAIPKEDLEELGEALTPNSSMMLLLLEDTYSEGVISSMAGYSGDVVTLTVGDDLSGEIAYTQGAVTDAAGDVVAGESAVAADSAGDAVAASDVAAATADDSSSSSDEFTPKASS